MLATVRMPLARNIAIALLLLSLLKDSTFAQTPSQLPTCTILANVRDRHGAFVQNLPLSAFRAKYQGKPLAIHSTVIDPDKNRIVLLLDVSGSIALSKHTWEMERMVAEDFLRNAARPGRTAMVLFASDVVATMDFSHSPTEMVQTLDRFSDANKLAPKGHHTTALLDAVLYGINILGNAEPGDVVYAITDGGDNHSRHTQHDMEEGLLKNGVRFFSFYLTDSNFGTEEQRVGPRFLRDLSILTGGATLDIPDSNGSILYDLSAKGKAQIAAGLAYLYDLMGHYYELRLDQLPESGKKNLELDLLDSAGRKSKDLTVMYPQRLSSCFTEGAK